MVLENAARVEADIINLDRQFVRFRSEEPRDEDMLRYIDALDSSLMWTDLLTHRRVVVLAEAGSGKSTELSRQADLLRSSGKRCFLLTLQNVARRGGVEQAMGTAA